MDGTRKYVLVSGPLREERPGFFHAPAGGIRGGASAAARFFRICSAFSRVVT